MIIKTDLQSIFKLGRKIRFLKNCSFMSSSYTVKGNAWITGNLETVKQRFEEFGDERTTKDIDKLLKKLNRNYKKEDRLKITDGHEINQKVKIWEDRIINLLIEKVSIESPTSTILNYSQLLKGSEGFFSDKRVKKIPKIAVKDFDDCCYCLLVGLPTPSAVMALRAVEASLRFYYKRKTNKDPKELEWGPMTEDIKKIQNHDKDLITHLDNLRKNLRNKVMHPERRFEQREMEELFVTVIRAIGDLIK